MTVAGLSATGHCVEQTGPRANGSTEVFEQLQDIPVLPTNVGRPGCRFQESFT